LNFEDVKFISVLFLIAIDPCWSQAPDGRIKHYCWQLCSYHGNSSVSGSVW